MRRIVQEKQMAGGKALKETKKYTHVGGGVTENKESEVEREWEDGKHCAEERCEHKNAENE